MFKTELLKELTIFAMTIGKSTYKCLNLMKGLSKSRHTALLV